MTHPRPFNSVTRFLPTVLPAVLLLVALSLTIAACGGGDDEEAPSTPTAPATAMATPVPTQAPATATGGQSSSGTEEIFVRASGDNSFSLALNAGDVVELDYSVESRIQGRSESGGNIGGIESGVQFAVIDSTGNIIYQADQLSEHKATITAEVTGEHMFTFVNTFRAQGQSVTANYSINP